MRRDLPIALLLAATFAGCAGGGSDNADGFKDPERKAIAQVVDDLRDKAATSDSEDVCDDLLTKELVQRIERASGGSCADELDDAFRDTTRTAEMDIEKIDINGQTATAVVQQESGDFERRDTLTFTQVSRVWRISSLGG